MDILRDIIADMQHEIDQLKIKKANIAIWNLTQVPHTDGPLLRTINFVFCFLLHLNWYVLIVHRRLDHQSMESTLKGMVRQLGDQKTFIINIAGLYRITATLNWSRGGCEADNIQINIDNQIAAAKYDGNYGPGTVSIVRQLKKGTKVVFDQIV